MKIRSDYVSNSSSSSFIIRKDAAKAAKMFLDDFIEQESFSEVLYRVLENTGLDFQIAGRDWGDAEEVLVGYDMKDGDNKMKESETLKEYKTRVVDALNEKGLDAKYDEVDIVTGGSDAGGTTFFNECG